ncbi:hypothetical protein OAJ57_01055 [Alphaproteobacteria bacterium]|nr:hypothetical protein [Alphaproteobacteria bacterium]
MIINEIQATASPRDLLVVDAERPLVDLANHELWQTALSGEMSRDCVARLLLLLYPVVAGPGRYLFSAKLSQISPEDGAQLFRQLYEAEQNPVADADVGWRAVGMALGVAEYKFDEVSKNLHPAAADFLAIMRQHSLRSSPSAAATVAWAIERQLPRLWGGFADSLAANYDVPEDSLAHLRYHAARSEEVEGWIEQLLQRYFDTAETYAVFEARRALWEAVWAWTALIESLDS